MTTLELTSPFSAQTAVVRDRETRLSSLLRSGQPVKTPRAVEVVSAVAERLGGLHEAGIAHGDIQPDNILVRRDPESGSFQFDLAEPGPGRNSPAVDYAAPEVIQGDPPSTRSDVYSLGCVFYRLLAGRPPYERETPEQTLQAHLHDSPRPVTFLRPDLPGRVDEVVASALAKDPANRLDTAPRLAENVRESVVELPAEIPEATPPEEENGQAPQRARRSGRRAFALAIVVIIVVAGAVTATLLLTGRSDDLGGGVPPDQAQLMQRIDPSTNELVATVPTGRSFVFQTTIGDPRLWVADPFGGVLLQIHGSRNEIERAARVPGRPTDLTVDDESLWFASVTDDPETDLVSRIDLASWEIDSDVALRVRNPVALEFAAGAIWVASAGEGQHSVLRVDPTNGQVLELIPLSFEPQELAFGQQALWIAGGAAPDAGRPTFVARVDPRLNEVTDTVRLSGSSFIHLAAGEGAVWAATTGDGALTRLNAFAEVTGRVTGLRPSGIAAGQGAVWMTDWEGGTIARISPATLECLLILDVGRGPRDPAVGAGGVWLSASEQPEVAEARACEA